MLSASQLRLYRTRFGWGFVASFIVLAASSLWVFTLSAPDSTAPLPPPTNSSSSPTPIDPGGGGGGGGTPSNQPGINAPPPLTPASATDLTLFISAASLLTSTASLAGFLFTTILSWRKERREQQGFDVDLAKKQLEVEKLRRELDKPFTGSDGDPH